MGGNDSPLCEYGHICGLSCVPGSLDDLVESPEVRSLPVDAVAPAALHEVPINEEDLQRNSVRHR